MSTQSKTSIDIDFVDRLKSLPLFKHVGESNIHNLKFDYRQLSSVNDVNNQLNSTNWENFTLESRNRLTVYLIARRNKDYQAWNELTEAYKKELSYFEPLVNDFVEQSKIDKVFVHDFNWIFLALCMENHYSKLDSDIPILFQYFLPLYEAGHIPCGWQGAITEDHKGKPIDITKGILLVY